MGGSKDKVQATETPQLSFIPGTIREDEVAVQSEPSVAGKLVSDEEDVQNDSTTRLDSTDPVPPPLPPRPTIARTQDSQLSESHTLASTPSKPLRPILASKATTAISTTEAHTYHSLEEGPQGAFSTPTSKTDTNTSITPQNISRIKHGDLASLRSYAPTLDTGGDVESLLGEILRDDEGPSWAGLPSQFGAGTSSEDATFDDTIGQDYENEFEEVQSSEDFDEVLSLAKWRSKYKHFLILSLAGKPIYTRHGDKSLVSNYIGICQTIISYYQGIKDPLLGFTAGDARVVVRTEGPLHLVAISRRLEETDAQLRNQLDALYMQILSTLTLPTLNHLFTNRPSTDLQKPLQGTDTLLNALTDAFTQGSPSTLLSSLECLKLKKSHRAIINSTLLKTRSSGLLYGLVVAGGRLVSVARPKKHSLHPSDLQLIFNMLFEAQGVKAAGGENWIPFCLPGFNKTGYLYMYVSFLPAREDGLEDPNDFSTSPGKEDQIAVILISADKESFYELQRMRDDLIEQMESNGSMKSIRLAVAAGRPSTTAIAPGTVLRHFLYKSRGNVQFVMPTYDPHYKTLLDRRRLLSLYHNLHGTVHAKNAHLKVHHCISRHATSLAWITPAFELYCVASPYSSKNALAQGASKIIQWVRREEERLFIIGGAVF